MNVTDDQLLKMVQAIDKDEHMAVSHTDDKQSGPAT